MKSIISQCGKTLFNYNFPSLDEVAQNVEVYVQDATYEVFRTRPLLNTNQFTVAATSEQPNDGNHYSRLFFMDGHASCDKTFTYNYKVAEMHGSGFSITREAWTGIVETLLKGGSTLHSLFKSPFPISESSACNVTPNSVHGQILSQIKFSLLDKANVIPKRALHAFEKLLQDACCNFFLLVAKVVLLDGDFRQLFHVVRRGRPTEIAEASFKSFLPWQWDSEILN